jgi:gliding motility-associated-like protein
LGVCQASATVTLHVNPAPVANAGQDTAICYGQSVQLRGSGGVTYAWSPGTYLDDAGIDDPLVSRPTENIVYSLTVTDALGCRSLQPDQVAVTVTPPPAISLSHDTAILADQPVYLDVQDVNNSGFSVFVWSPADGLSDPTIANPVAIVGTSITYTVVAATPNGCEATASIAIKVYSVSDLFVPNAFTPNGDGHNDVLRVIPVGIRELNYFTVFNRWGQRVFATQRLGAGWDGRVNGVVQPAGTYVWMAGGINYNGEVVERKGVTMLIR